jgi:hypothetical protein
MTSGNKAAGIIFGSVNVANIADKRESLIEVFIPVGLRSSAQSATKA